MSAGALLLLSKSGMFRLSLEVQSHSLISLNFSELALSSAPDSLMARGLPCFVHIIPDIDLNLFTFFHRKSIHVRPFVRLTVLTEDLMMTGRHCV